MAIVVVETDIPLHARKKVDLIQEAKTQADQLKAKFLKSPNHGIQFTILKKGEIYATDGRRNRTKFIHTTEPNVIKVVDLGAPWKRRMAKRDGENSVSHREDMSLPESYSFSISKAHFLEKMFTTRRTALTCVLLRIPDEKLPATLQKSQKNSSKPRTLGQLRHAGRKQRNYRF